MPYEEILSDALLERIPDASPEHCELVRLWLANNGDNDISAALGLT